MAVDVTIDLNKEIPSKEFYNKIGKPIVDRYAEDFNNLNSLAIYANERVKGNNKAAITLFGAITRPSDIGMSEEDVKENPIEAIYRRNNRELAEVSYEVYKSAYRNSALSGAARQKEAINKANDFLYAETQKLSKYSYKSSPFEKQKFMQALASLSYAFNGKDDRYEAGQLGYFPYDNNYDIAPVVTPVDLSLNIGSKSGAFMTNTFDKTATGKAVMLTQKYKRAAMFEAINQPGDLAFLSESARMWSEAAGYAAMFAEMAVVAYLTRGAGLVALSAINGGLNDYLDSVALSRKYIKGNPFQKAHLQPFLISRGLEVTTSALSYGLIGPRFSEKIVDFGIDKLLRKTQSDVLSHWAATSARNAATLFADSAVDTGFDFIVYGAARSVDGDKGNILTAQDYNMYDPDNIFRVFLQRGIMRMANASTRNIVTLFNGSDNGWGKKEFFYKAYEGQLVARDKGGARGKIAAKLARFSWRVMDTVSPNHYKEMDMMLRDSGGLIATVKNKGDYFDDYVYSSLYHYYELNNNNVYRMFEKLSRKSSDKTLLIDMFKGKDTLDIEYIIMRDNKVVELPLVDGNREVNYKVVETLGKFISNEIVEIDKMKDKNNSPLSSAEKLKLFKEFKMNLFNVAVQTETVTKGDTQRRKIKQLNSDAFSAEEKATIASQLQLEVNAVIGKVKDKKFMEDAKTEMKTVLGTLDYKQRESLSTNNDAFVEKLRTFVRNKNIPNEQLYADSSGYIYTESEFKNFEAEVFKSNEAQKEYFKRYENKIMNGEDTSNLSLSELSQRVVMLDKYSLVNQISFDVINKIRENPKAPARPDYTLPKDITDKINIIRSKANKQISAKEAELNEIKNGKYLKPIEEEEASLKKSMIKMLRKFIKFEELDADFFKYGSYRKALGILKARGVKLSTIFTLNKITQQIEQKKYAAKTKTNNGIDTLKREINQIKTDALKEENRITRPFIEAIDRKYQADLDKFKQAQKDYSMSPSRLRSAMFDEGGVLDSYRQEISDIISKATQHKPKDKDGWYIFRGEKVSKQYIQSKIMNIMNKYHAAITILGDRAGADVLEKHRKAYSALLTNPANKDFLSPKALKSSAIGKAIHDAFEDITDDEYSEVFTAAHFYPAISNMRNRNNMMSLIFNQYNRVSKNTAYEYLKGVDESLTEKDLISLETISIKGFNTLGSNVQYSVKMNGEEFVIDDKSDPMALYQRKVFSDDPFDMELLARSLIKLKLIDEIAGTTELPAILSDLSLDGKITITHSDIGSIDGFEITFDSDIDGSVLKNLYGIAFNEQTGIKTYQNDEKIKNSPGNESEYVVGNKETQFNDLRIDFSIKDGISTGMPEIVSAMINMTNRANVFDGIKRVLADSRPDLWAKLGEQQQNRFAQSIQTHFEYWNSFREAISITRLARDKYSFDPEITVLPLSQNRISSAVQLWAINTPDFKDKKGVVSQSSVSKWRDFLRENNLISIGEAGTGQAEIFVKLPSGTEEYRLKTLAKALGSLDVNIKGLADKVKTFGAFLSEDPDRAKSFNNGELTYKKMLEVFTSYIKSRFETNLKKQELTEDSSVDEKKVTEIYEEFMKTLTEKTKKLSEEVDKVIKENPDLAMLLTISEQERLRDQMSNLFKGLGVPSLLTDNQADKAREIRDKLNNFSREWKALQKTLSKMENAQALFAEIKEYDAWLDLHSAEVTNEVETYLENIMVKQYQGIWGKKIEEVDSFVEGMPEEKAKRLLYRTVISGPASVFYGLDYAKRFGLLSSSNSIFTLNDGSLRKAAADWMGSLAAQNKTLRLIFTSGKVGPSGEAAAAGLQFLPRDLLNMIYRFIATTDMSQKLAINLGGWIHKGIYVPNSNFKEVFNNFDVQENDIILNAEDTKNMPPEMLEWLKTNNVNKPNKKWWKINNVNKLNKKMYIVELDPSKPKGKEAITTFLNSLTLQTELTSSTRNQGTGLGVSSLVPSVYRQVNNLIKKDANFSKQWETIRDNMEEAILWGSLDKYHNAISKALRKGIKTEGAVAQAMPILKNSIRKGDYEVGKFVPTEQTVQFKGSSRVISSDIVKTLFETHKSYWSTHQIINAYRITKRRMGKNSVIDKATIQEADEARDRLIKMDNGGTLAKTWKDDIKLLLNIVSHDTVGIFSKVTNGKNEIYLASLDRNPGQRNYQNSPFVIAGIRAPGSHRCIEISNGVMTRLLKGDFDGDLLIGTRLSKELLKNIMVGESGEKIDTIKGLLYLWIRGAETAHLTSGHIIKPQDTPSLRDYKADERMFVGGMYSSVEKFLAMVSLYDGFKITTSMLRDTDTYKRIKKRLEDVKLSDNKDQPGLDSLLEKYPGNKMSLDAHNFILYDSTSENIWGKVHGSIKVLAKSSITDEGTMVVSFNTGSPEGRKKGILITRQDTASGGFKIIGGANTNIDSFSTLNEIARDFDVKSKNLIGSDVATLEAVIEQVFSDRRIQELIPLEVIKGKRIMSIAALPEVAADAGINNASTKTDVRVSTYIISRYGSLKKANEAFTDFSNRAFVATAFPIITKGTEEGFYSSIFYSKHDDKRIEQAIDTQLMNTNAKFIKDLAKKFEEGGYGHGINKKDIDLIFTLTSKTRMDPQIYEEVAKLWDTKLRKLDWGKLPNIHPRLTMANTILGQIASDESISEKASALDSILDKDIESEETNLLLSHINNRMLPFVTPITIGDEKINVESAAYFLKRNMNRIANLYSLGSEEFGLEMYGELVGKKPVSLKSPPIDKAGDITPARYYKDVTINANLVQKQPISERDVEVLFSKLAIGVQPLTLKNAETLSNQDLIDLTNKHLNNTLTKKDIKRYTKATLKEIVTLTKGGKSLSVDGLYLAFAKYIDAANRSVAEIRTAKAILQGVYATMDMDTKTLLTLRDEGLSHSIVKTIRGDRLSHVGKISAHTIIEVAKNLKTSTSGLLDINQTPRQLLNEMENKEFKLCN